MPFPKPYQNDTMIDTSIMDYGEFQYQTMGIGSRRSAIMSSGLFLETAAIEHVGGEEDGDEKKSRRRRKRLKGNA
jgi:hypothetical protein